MYYSKEDFLKWKDYIDFKIKYKKVSLPKELEDFLLNLSVIYLDYKDFMTEEKGIFYTYYMDVEYKEEKIHIRRTESEEYCMDNWGLLNQEPEECFDTYLRNKYDLDLKQEMWVLDVIRDFFNIIQT